MAIQSRQNLFAGVNPFLEYLWPMPQSDSPSIFPSFHKDHITHISDALNLQLPAHYVAHSEPSLQIRTEIGLKEPEPNVAIYRKGEGISPGVAVATLPTWQVILAAEEIKKKLSAVVIYEVRDHSTFGKPVTRIELLSPGNKRGGSGYNAYISNRTTALLSETNLIEIDYLHEFPSPMKEMLNLPRYPVEQDSYPYKIAISKPDHHETEIAVYGFSVEMPIPKVNLPLLHGESISFDFNEVYNYTFTAGRWGTYIDYDTTLPSLSTYSPEDQARIQTRLNIIKGDYHANSTDHP